MFHSLCAVAIRYNIAELSFWLLLYTIYVCALCTTLLLFGSASSMLRVRLHFYTQDPESVRLCEHVFVECRITIYTYSVWHFNPLQVQHTHTQHTAISNCFDYYYFPLASKIQHTISSDGRRRRTDTFIYLK